MKRILVVANETAAGRPLIEAVRRHAGDGEVSVHVICPQNQPKHGYVIYDSMVREATENRLKMTIALLHEAGIEADGEVMDPDPYAAVMDALGERDYDEIIVSTHPETRSGWLREGLVDRLRRATRRPVDHVVVDLDKERDEIKRTLVVANQTVAGKSLLDALSARRAGAAPLHVICPVRRGPPDDGAHEWLAHTLEEPRPPGWRRSDRSCTRPVYGDPERAAVLRARRRGDLDPARDALGVAARELIDRVGPRPASRWSTW